MNYWRTSNLKQMNSVGIVVLVFYLLLYASSLFAIDFSRYSLDKSDPVHWCNSANLPVPTALKSKLQSEITPHELAVYYVIPSDIEFEETVYLTLIDITLDVQAWYQCATGGVTWKLAYPEVVKVFHAPNPREYYTDDWWGRLQGDMNRAGLPVWEPGTVTAIWARGAGFWAGGAKCGGEGNCGVALTGVEIIPEFNNPEWSGDHCPDGVGVGEWPCVPEGAFAHELGHTLGLPHPIDDPITSASASHSIMQTHWNYPVHAPPHETPWGFLTVERRQLRESNFMMSGIELLQRHPSCDVLNLPVNGPTPSARFTTQIQGSTISITNTSAGADSFYWTFGDGGVSNDENPIHTYLSSDSYVVTLRAGNQESMIDLTTRQVDPVFQMNAGLNDAWYNPLTDGQGFFITIFPELGVASLAWFTYDTELPPDDTQSNLGDPGHRWLTAVGPIEANQAIMQIELTSGGIFDTPSTIQRTDPPGSDGAIILTFESCNSGTVEYDIPSINRQGIVSIRRVANDNTVVCEALSKN